MTIHVLGVAGSPRPQGNSTSLLDGVLEVARDKGLDVGEVSLNDLYYRGCQACLGCVQAGRCVLPDECQALLSQLIQAHIWVFAAPIYFDGVSGQMKLFFDRLFSLTHEGCRLQGKRRAALLVTYEAPRSEFYEEVVRRLAGYFPRFGEFEKVETLAISMGDATTPVRDRPEVMSQAKALAARLFEGVSQPAGPPATMVQPA